MNTSSSRSHALCTITLQASAPPTTAASPSKYPLVSQPSTTVYSKIQLVDLAGSERLTQGLSKTTKETCQINRGLHALSNVIMALSTPSSTFIAHPHVPYRDSKLTRVLQDSLGGSAKTLMIACVSAADESVQESLSTLQYATRARRIQNRITAPAPVEPPTDDSIVNLQWTILRKCLSCAGMVPIPEVLMQV
jgi:Kinesin motor domain